MILSKRIVAVATMSALSVGWTQQGPPQTAPVGDSGLAAANTIRAIVADDPTARDAKLRKLVSSGTEDIAAEALVALIRLHSTKLENPGVDALSRFSDYSIFVVLGVLEQSRDASLRTAIARACLRRAAEYPAGPKATELHKARQGVSGYAAMMMANSRDPIDRDLIQSALKHRPEEYGLWLALASIGMTRPEEFALARKIFQGPSGMTKLSAAAALAPTDSSANGFVTSAITGFLAGSSQIDAQTIVARSYAGFSKGTDHSFLEFQLQASMLVVLEFIQSPDAEHLTFDYLDANNQWIRSALGLIAAKRWPERLLSTDLSRDDERMSLLATTAAIHPELLSRVRSMMPSQELEKRLKRLNGNALEALFPNASIAGLVF